jgi:hypothetical protein
MQLTASKLAVHALRVCHSRSGSVDVLPGSPQLIL